LADLSSIKLGVITLTVGHWDLMHEHWKAIYDTYPYQLEPYIIPNLKFERSLSAAHNLGVKRAFQEGCDYIMYIADDVIPAPGDMENMLSKLIDDNLWVCYAWPGYEGSMAGGYCFYAAGREVFNTIGYWDEDFYPAYFEDNDYEYRIKLVNPEKIGQSIVMGQHLSSVTLNRMNREDQMDFQNKFEQMKTRYVQKWGGLPTQETYTTPFNTDLSQFENYH
jgi:hypothetical protein